MNNIDKSFKTQFEGSNNLYSHLKFTKTSNDFSSKSKIISSETPNIFTAHFDSSINSFPSQVNLNDTSTTFTPKAEITPVEEDIYYDEIIYYDGGGVDGWLLKNDM